MGCYGDAETQTLDEKQRRNEPDGFWAEYLLMGKLGGRVWVGSLRRFLSCSYNPLIKTCGSSPQRA